MTEYVDGIGTERPPDKKLRLFREAGQYIFPKYSSSVKDSTVRTMLGLYEVQVWERLAQDVAKTKDAGTQQEAQTLQPLLFTKK